ncbi:uncharacterized protein LOC132295389 [Cornus florida]|uniref:uncharacterized protein LOC132295389 n=1 Tax=Cornus florida TaxID=4283 RepID=UPI00289EDDED|nr:uncharacterized protein LOC132295389 [Cornus florida]XP_059649641.1 uncharacterized protein LOC132295389 [Cornus florida]XP_059649642.1 uncharacterized protein LOC132295389 [Cornus florida]
MVKLASAQESQIYGPQLAQNRSEYINAGLYMFATIVLLYSFAVRLASEPKLGLVLLLLGLALIIFVNVHDLLAHLAGIDYRLPLMEFDVQLGLIEFAVPVVQITATLLYFLGILFIFIQVEIAKLLLEVGQTHLLQHWPEPGIDDDEKLAFFDQVARLNANYPGGLASYIKTARELLADSKAVKNPFDGFTPSLS